jgi:hypothetical protein
MTKKNAENAEVVRIVADKTEALSISIQTASKPITVTIPGPCAISIRLEKSESSSRPPQTPKWPPRTAEEVLKLHFEEDR